MAKTEKYYGTGRRKKAIARVRLIWTAAIMLLL